MTNPVLDLLLLHFCLVRTRYFLLRLSPLLFCHYSKTIDPIVSLLISAQLLKLSALNVLLQKEKRCRLKHFGKKLHLPPSHDTSKFKDNEQRNSPAFEEVLLSTISSVSCFNWWNVYIFISTLCHLITNKRQKNVISYKQYQMNIKTLPLSFSCQIIGSYICLQL